jgi:hypothetical protein
MHRKREIKYLPIYKKYRSSERGKFIHRLSNIKWEKKNKIKSYVHKKLHWALYSGGIVNNDFICAICGKQPIEKHHENYYLWFSFIPLCKKHHVYVHVVGEGEKKHG